MGSVLLRTRENGDYLEINKDHNRKSLQDYLVNEKVPKEVRDQVPLLACGNHILWVVGKRISELRAAFGWNQVQLAERLNISKQTVSNWENENII